ncbi:formate dehydrogenase, gamma subunit [Roseovarius mucosus DSM 17069]|uniref:Formate dehydrogenase, gamma subunit n=1 Tax=Roseovarius mucosus DSM 17069 TaxID=1288298 RepID=A0A0A0HIJ6_9RHOB|nr:formate dehydrogenase subunit gamma [Roseovarius mucosus]KGM86504.1 formate dehydrogenase, gamma subunit [Roseovarius mucosus DSM 17069]
MSEKTYVKRYSALARANHWVTAISLVLLALSGMALFHPSLYFLTGLFGGGANVREFHPWIGLVLAISFLGLFVRFWKLNLWERNDNVWLARLRSVLAGREEDLPEMGKYNAGQKMVFWLMSILIIALFFSGVVLWDAKHEWMATTLGLTFTIEQSRIAVLVHAIAAVIAIVVWIVHVYAAIWVKGTLSAMVKGEVTGGWGWRHHRRWLREEVGKTAKGNPPAE